MYSGVKTLSPTQFDEQTTISKPFMLTEEHENCCSEVLEDWMVLTSGSTLLASVWDGTMSLPNQWQMHVGWRCPSPDQLIQVRVKTETWRGSEQFRQCKYSLGWMKSGFTSLSRHKQRAPVQRYTIAQSRSCTWVEVLKTGLDPNPSQDQVQMLLSPWQDHETMREGLKTLWGGRGGQAFVFSNCLIFPSLCCNFQRRVRRRSRCGWQSSGVWRRV